MKSFIQRKPGISFYGDSKVSLAIRKNYIEYVFEIGPDMYGVINLIINAEGLTFIADCGSFFTKLREILPSVSLSRSESPLLSGLLLDENKDFFLGSVENRNASLGPQGIVYTYYSDVEGQFPFTLAGKPENLDKAALLLVFAQRLFIEVSQCKESKIQNLIPYFTM